MADESAPEIQGTPGEPAGEAGGSGWTDEELLKSFDSHEETPSAESKAPDPNEEHIKWLRSQDPTKLPEDIRQKLEYPFLQHYTKKFQEVSQSQQTFLDRVAGKLTQQGVEPTPNELQELRERVRSGDMDALDGYVDRMLQERVGPMQQQQSLQNAVAQAEQINPAIKTMQAEIGQVLEANPALKEMATRDNFRFAPQVLAGLGFQLENQRLKAEQAQFEMKLKTVAREAIAADRRRLQGLPPATTLAGKQTGARPVGPEPKNMQEAAIMALKQLGQEIPEEWR